MATVGKLQETRNQAESLVSLIKIGQRRVNELRGSLVEKVDEYAKERINLLLAELKARGLSWCTRCNAILPESELELLMVIEGREYDSHRGFGSFFKLHRSCAKCYTEAGIRSGTYGKWDSCAEDQTSFLFHPVEKRDDGYYFRRYQNSEWEKLDEQKYALPIEPPRDLVKKLAAEFKLPPEIRVNSGDEIREV